MTKFSDQWKGGILAHFDADTYEPVYNRLPITSIGEIALSVEPEHEGYPFSDWSDLSAHVIDAWITATHQELIRERWMADMALIEKHFQKGLSAKDKQDMMGAMNMAMLMTVRENITGHAAQACMKHTYDSMSAWKFCDWLYSEFKDAYYAYVLRDIDHAQNGAVKAMLYVIERLGDTELTEGAIVNMRNDQYKELVAAFNTLAPAINKMHVNIQKAMGELARAIARIEKQHRTVSTSWVNVTTGGTSANINYRDLSAMHSATATNSVRRGR